MHKIAAESERKRHAIELFAGLPRHYDRVAAAFSFGQDPRWRRAMVAAGEAQPGDRARAGPPPAAACAGAPPAPGGGAGPLPRRYGCSVGALDKSDAMLGAARARLERD